MNRVLSLLFFHAFLALVPNLLSAQVNLKVEAITGSTDTYGVYVKVCDDQSPSSNTITGSGQVTLKYPVGKVFTGFASVSGNWQPGAPVVGPAEAPDKVYVSVGFQQDLPHILYQADGETLLFTFKLTGAAPGTPSLIVNGQDPFDQLPNSMSSNPGNELTVFDFGVQPVGLYTYVGNYTNGSVNCGNEPQDTTVVNPPGDTTTQDTTIVNPPGDTTTQDTTIVNPPGDTTTQDTTIINPPGDTTQQTSSVRELEKRADQFTIYPTPAFEWVTVKFLDSAMAGGTIRIYTLSGVPIGAIERGQRPELTLSVNGLPPGMYLLRYVKNGKALQQGKFLKQ
jgi:hypothetical protein